MPTSRRLAVTLIAVAAAIAVLPLIVNGCSCGHDFDFHLLSWLEAARQFSHGDLHPHWASSPAYNAGEPRFVFYPPLSWTIGALLTLLLTHLPFVSAAHGFTVAPILYTWLALTAAGLALYALARRYVSAPTALIAATLYLANPYTLFTAYERTAYAELLAAALLPLLLLAILPSPDDRPRISIPRIALAVALLWLTNAPAAVMGSYTLALLAVVYLLSSYRRHHNLRALVAPASSFIAGATLGLALAAFYILPAAYERRWVEISMATIPGMRIVDNTLFHHTSDPEHDAVLHTASIIAILLLALTAIALVFAWSGRRAPSSNPGTRASEPLRKSSVDISLLTALSILTAAITILLTPVAAPIWRYAPELAFLQFPWRFLAIVAPVLALSFALAFRNLHLRTPAAIALSLILPAALTLAAWPAFRQACDPPDTPDAQLAGFSAGAGADPTDEYTPITADNDALAHINPAWTLAPALSPSAPAGPAPTHLDLDLNVPETLVLNLRDYPAWRLTRDGSPVTDRVDRPDGLLAVPLPPGHSHLELAYLTTPDQIAGDAISATALCVLIPLALVSPRRRKSSGPSTPP